MADIRQRKKDHVELTVTEGTQYSQSSGFDRFNFVHNALPEVDYNEVSTEATLLGRSFAFPLFISSMTGGYAEAGPVNAIIAEFCEQFNLPFGVGSQRAMLEDVSVIKTFSIVREKAPTAFIAANIGGAQLVGGFSKDAIMKITGSIEADAIIIHLNPLQELMQPEGDTNFKGVLEGIEQLVNDAHVPVLVKETGAGISKYVAKRLLNAGVEVIDVAGAGGTSWAKVENYRSSNKNPNHSFDNWGIPTAQCIRDISSLQWERSFELIASGGIRTAHDIAKSLCLGATFTASAQPVIKAISESGLEGLEILFEVWKKDLKIILTLLGCSTLKELNSTHLIEKTDK
ncbi:MAG: type 2 isopentenyl-diphosphate Delta-isomerase [Balneola sp.]|nr:MAG: type 2 isopentenyl-diphosphate Delta-isomerase [Balneola sp.]